MERTSSPEQPSAAKSSIGSESSCQFCNNSKHETKDHKCSFCGEVGGHNIKDCPNTKCKFCRYNPRSHETKDHKCNMCGLTGLHAAFDCPQKKCKICGLTGHKPKDHTCERKGCKLYSEHVHNCIYCDVLHTTEEHQCWRCKDFGHSDQDHFKKAYCIDCWVVGHHASDKHVKCEHCKYIYIETQHYWCNHCDACDTRKHEDALCEYCNGCLVVKWVRQCYECDNENELYCSKCFKRPGDLERYDVKYCTRVPLDGQI